MTIARFSLMLVVAAAIARSAAAQPPPPPPEPPRVWDTQIGGSFVGTSGNTATSTVGADFVAHRRWPGFQIESTAAAVRTSDQGTRTAERYLAAVRGRLPLTSLLSLAVGERVERDRFSGVDLRSILDAGLGWALVRGPRWTLDAITGVAWKHERAITGPDRNSPIGVLQGLSRVPLGASGETTQRLTVYPDFRDSSTYRSEAEATVQAALNSRLALKFGYLWRYSNAPVPGFTKIDNTTTASVVLRLRAATLAP